MRIGNVWLPEFVTIWVTAGGFVPGAFLFEKLWAVVARLGPVLFFRPFGAVIVDAICAI
jgi:hypothetical protein